MIIILEQGRKIIVIEGGMRNIRMGEETIRMVGGTILMMMGEEETMTGGMTTIT